MIEFVGKFRLHQFGTFFEIAMRYRENGSWHGTDFHRSYYGYLLGYTEPFKDEESATRAFEEAVRFLCAYSTQNPHRTPRRPEAASLASCAVDQG